MLREEEQRAAKQREAEERRRAAERDWSDVNKVDRKKLRTR